MMIFSSYGPGGYFEEENPPEHPESKILWCDGKQKDHSIDCLDEEPCMVPEDFNMVCMVKLSQTLYCSLFRIVQYSPQIPLCIVLRKK